MAFDQEIGIDPQQLGKGLLSFGDVDEAVMSVKDGRILIGRGGQLIQSVTGKLAYRIPMFGEMRKRSFWQTEP